MRTSWHGTSTDDGWTSKVSSGFALAGFLGLVFVAFTLLAMGPLAKFEAYFNLTPPPESWLPVLHVTDRVGQRAVCLPILGLVTFLVCRRQESWRPAVVAGTSVFMLNLVVLILKVGLGRDFPHSADPSFFGGGMSYPSGHTANIMLVYGLIAYLLSRYSSVGRRTLVVVWSIIALLSVTMVMTSLVLDWHWFADLIAGLLVGGIVLQLTATIDHAVPDTALHFGWRRGARGLPRLVRPGHAHAPREPVRTTVDD